jgi:hypothetical protein
MRHAVILCAALLAGCADRGADNGSVAEVAEIPGSANAKAPDTPAPQIAYRYDRLYRAEADGIAALQDRHIALCDRAGPAACRIESQKTADADTGQNSSLILSVAAGRARLLLAQLDQQVIANGGTVQASGAEADDLATRIVDVEARLRAKQALVDRLLAIIRTRNGSIKDVVAAEHAFADAQGDLESAQGELALMRRKVARSTITLTYVAPAGLRTSLNQTVLPAVDEASSLLGASVAVLLRLAIIGLPWLLVLGVPLWLWRRRRVASGNPSHDSGAV